MSYVPESGYGIFNDYEEDGGFVFGDNGYEDFGIQRCEDEPKITITTGPAMPNGASEPAPKEKSSTVNPSGFVVGGDSPEQDHFITEAQKPSKSTKPASTHSKQTSSKQKHGRFSPNLPHKPFSSKRGYKGSGDLRSKYRKGRGFKEAKSCDLREQSQILEKGEELLMAITRGNVERVKEILDSGFDVKQCLSSGWPPLLHACDCAKEEVVELLLDRGADPNTHKDYYTALMVICAIKSAGKRDSLVTCARFLINKGAKVNAGDRHQMSPLLYASQNGHLALVELLISANADVHKQESRNWTALSLAASKGYLAIVQLLVSHGADPGAQTYMGDSPSVLALDGGHTEVADWLDSITSSQGSVANFGTVGGARKVTTTSVSAASGKQGATQTDEPGQHALPSSSDLQAAECVHYGDLELFLLGQQLGDLLPLFRQHKIQFSDLISITERDLETMGVTQVGSRKKLLSGIVDIHQRQWDTPRTSNLPYGKAISCSEATIILSHITRHTNYIKGTLRYLENQVQANPDILDVHTQTKEVEKLTNELAGTVEAVGSFREEVKSLQSNIKDLLPNTAKQSDLKSGAGRNALKVAGAVAVISILSYCAFRLLKQ